MRPLRHRAQACGLQQSWLHRLWAWISSWQWRCVADNGAPACTGMSINGNAGALVFHFQGSGIEGGDLSGHQAILGLIGIRAAVGFCKKGSFGPPLNIDRVAYYERVLSGDLQSTGSSLGWRLHDLGKHLA